MVFNEIILESGQPLDLKTLNPIMGFQCIHKVTSRILPSCKRFEIYGQNAMVEKINEVVDFHYDDFDITEYHIEPMYMSEIDEMKSGFVFVMNEQDIENDLNNDNL